LNHADAAQLAEAIREAGVQVSVPLSGAQIACLAHYVELVFKWNRVSNLIGVRDVGEFVTRHLSDCLSVLPYVHGATLADVGSGAGLPGLVLACVRPDLGVFLIEPRAKRARFLEHARLTLALNNVEVVGARIEDWAPTQAIASVICRAFGSVPDFVLATRALQVPGCRLLAMKGQVPTAELAGIDDEKFASRVHQLQVPGWQARHLVELVCR